jgi:sugar O-acyltransferase (sialic acid O-acetyltransferase NeuD family)
MPITDIIIAGAGGFGREVFEWISDQITHDKNFRIAGFIDDTLPTLQNYPPILGTILDYIPKQNEKIVLAFGNPDIKKTIGNSLLEKHASFFSVIHPSVKINTNTQIETGCILCPYVIISNDCVLEKCVTINSMTTIGHDVHIEEWSVISGHCDITGHTKIGKMAFLGSRSGTVPGITLGDNVTVGAGSTVVRSVANNTTVFGIPARKI